MSEKIGTNKEISSLKKAFDILEENGFHILKAEEEPDNPHTYKGIINLKIVSKDSSNNIN